MTVNTFWNIIIKISGLWLIFEFLELFSQTIASSAYLLVSDVPDPSAVWVTLMISLLIMLLYVAVVALFLFRTSQIVDGLKLDRISGVQTINLPLSGPALITVAVIVIGGIVFINGFALLCKSGYDYFKQQKLQNYNPTTGWIIFNAVKALLGYLLMTNGKAVAGFISKESGTVRQ